MAEPMPIADQVVFKEKFIERYSALTNWEEFRTCSLSWLRKSIRVNTLKITVPELVQRLTKDHAWQLDPIPWCKEGFFIRGARRDVGNLAEHVLGYIYVQEAASMIPPLVLDPQPGELVLDMAAAPGSKTTQIAMHMQNQGLLIANDVEAPRLAALGINLQRCGVSNAVITKMRGRTFEKVPLQFDRILVDAPCSGTGTIRKSLKTIGMWNPKMIQRLAATQRNMLKVAFGLLKPGGTLVYSTCSLEPEEDESVISAFLDHADKQSMGVTVGEIDLPLKRGDPVKEFDGQSYRSEVEHCLRLWPQDNDTEGFFVTKLIKEG